MSWENLPRNRFWGEFLEFQFADVIVDMPIMYPNGNVEKAVGCIWIWGIWERFNHHVFPTLSVHSFPLIYYPLKYDSEKAMAPHSSTLAWKIPWTEEPGRLQSMRSRRVGHDWATSLSLCTFTHWRRKWQPTPVFLPGESQGRGNLVGFRPWGRTESDTTEVT